MPPDLLSPRQDLPHNHTDCFDSDSETLYEPDGSPYARTMKHSITIRPRKLTPDQSPPVRQTRSASANSSAVPAATASAAPVTPSSTQANGTMTRPRALSSSSKRRAAAASLSNIKTDEPPPTKKRKPNPGDEIEVQPARSRESSTSTSISTLSTRRSSSSMPAPTSITPPFTSPLVYSKNIDIKLNKRSKTGETPLHRAAAQGRADYVRDLIARGATVNVQCFAGWTPLHKAALKGFVDIIEILCQHGANTDVQSTIEQDTPLHDACANGNMDVVRLLLQHGANPRIQNSAGFFPHEVVEDEFEELKTFMLNATNEFKESTTAQDAREDSEPPMSPATKRLSRRTSTASDAPLLVQTHQNGRSRRGGGSSGRGDDLLALDINYRDKMKRGNLTLGILQGNTDLVLKLLVMGAKVTAKDTEGNTPLHYAARGGHVEVAAALLEYGADVDALNKKNETPMHEVVGRDHKAMVELLLVMGADPTLKDSKGQTALDLLIEKKRMKGAEDEFPLLRAQFEQRGVELPPMPETEYPHVNRIKTEDLDEVAELVKAVEYDPAKADETNGSTELEVMDGRRSPSPRESLPPETVDSPVDNAPVEVPIPEEIESSKEVDVSTPLPADEPEAAPMEEVIQQESVPDPAPVEPVITPPSSQPPSSMRENPNVMPEIHDSSEVSAIPSPPSLPEVKELSPIAPVSQPTEEPMSVDIPEAEAEPAERALSEPILVDEVIEEEVTQETEVEITSPKAPSPPPPEPQWKKLAGLESLDASLEKEFSQILPIYTMNLKNETNVVSYVAHPQICSLLGFTSNEFFEKYSDISKRPLSNIEKSRFCTSFVSIISHPLTALTPHDLEEFLDTDIHESKGQGDLWHEFDKERKSQFMAMSVYLIPLDAVRDIIARDFPALSDLVSEHFQRLDTSDLDGGDAEIVYSDSAADRYIDCWRRVAGKYAACRV